MDHPMTKEESYADRRQLFKNIWDTALNIGGQNEANVIKRPKVIKTLRLNEVDRCVIGKKKKQRVKNLRTVCKKILNFCDQQDADDVFYEQTAKAPIRSSITNEQNPMLKKSMVTKVRKTKKTKNILTPIPDVVQPEATTSNRFFRLINSSKNASPLKIKKVAQSVQENYRKSEKRNTVEMLSGSLIPASLMYSNKRLYPINKIDIN